MKKLIVLLIIFNVKLNYSQKTGDDFKKEGKLDKAILAYKTALKEKPNNYLLNYNLASCFAIMYQKDSAFCYLKKALNTSDSLWALADNNLFSLTNDDRWITIENQQINKQGKKIKKPKFAKQLLKLIMKDQSFDYQIDMAKAHYIKLSSIPHWYYPIADLKSRISKDNFSKMEDLIDKNGWPTYTDVGKLAADAPLLIINHHKDEKIRIKYIDQIEKLCLAGEESCIEFAKIKDRILVNAEKKQLYGMQFKYNKNRKLVPFTIENPEFVDQRRAKIGLGPLKNYLKKKINYDFEIIQKSKFE